MADHSASRIGSIIETVESEQYGSYHQECIGVIDFPLMAETMEIDDICHWMETFHPKSYRGFSAWGLRHLVDGPRKDFVRNGFNIYALMVPSERVNQDWSSEGTNYQRQSGRYKPKGLPVAATDKKIEAWQSSLGFLVPEWIYEASTIDHLKDRYRKSRKIKKLI